MRLSPAATACVLLSLALILPACGEEPTAADESAAAKQARAPSAARSQGTAAAGRCRGQVHALLGSMDALREKLAVGLNYEDYLREVRRLKALYDEVPVRQLALDCLTTAGTPAERALNRYREAANTWGECLTQASCNAEEVEPKLQRRWALASSLLSTAQEGLRSAAG